MRHMITTILAALLALLIVAPASASIGDPTWRQLRRKSHGINDFWYNEVNEIQWRGGVASPKECRAMR